MSKGKKNTSKYSSSKRIKQGDKESNQYGKGDYNKYRSIQTYDDST